MVFDTRRIAAAAGEPLVKIYDKLDGRHWDCGPVDEAEANASGPSGDRAAAASIVDRVQINDGFLIEGRRNGDVGVWTC